MLPIVTAKTGVLSTSSTAVAHTKAIIVALAMALLNTVGL
jgi:hypothetical protein